MSLNQYIPLVLRDTLLEVPLNLFKKSAKLLLMSAQFVSKYSEASDFYRGFQSLCGKITLKNHFIVVWINTQNI